jgi:hypothetical protein
MFNLVFIMKILLAGMLTHIVGQYLLFFFSFNITLVIVSILAYLFIEGLDFIVKYVRF